MIKDKLKILKTTVRRWNVSIFGSIDERISSLELSISELDERAEQTGLSDFELTLRRNSFADLWQKLKDKETLLHQKSRQK